MASSVIAAILSLKDGMSQKVLQCGKSWDTLSKKEKSAAKSIMADVNKMEKQIAKFADKAKKVIGVAVAGAFVGAAKTGFEEALNLEGYRSQIETATKSTQRAAEVMTYAVNLANATPFEGGDMVAAAAALEMASLSAETYLTVLGDTAAGTNRTIADVQTQFIKALSTGQTTDFLQSINVAKSDFTNFAKTGGYAITSVDGTIKALKAFLEERFGGGMEKLATTTAGAWSTITGVSKSALAQIIGMGTDGTVRAGSALDVLREKSQSVAAQLVSMSQDGSLDAYARSIGTSLSAAMNFAVGLFNALYSLRGVIAVIAGVSATLWAAQKAMAAYKTITELCRVAQMIFNGTLMLSPWGMIAAAIAAVIGLTGIYTASMGAMTAANGAFASSCDDVANCGNGIASAGVGEIVGNKIAEGICGLLNMGIGLINTLAYPCVGDGGVISPLEYTPTYASGTTYHRGGIAMINERGGEIVNLPSGAKVIPADKSAQMMSGTTNNVTINVTINGADKSDEEIAEAVARRIVEEMDSVA